MGHVTGSMALVADAFHMLSDIVALVIAFISIVMSPKTWNKNTFGFARAEVLGALSNAVFLVALCFSILVEALKVPSSRDILVSLPEGYLDAGDEEPYWCLWANLL